MFASWGDSWGLSWGSSWGGSNSTADTYSGNRNWHNNLHNNWRIERENEKYRLELKREQLKQEEIIKLKVSVQENIIAKNDLLKLEESIQRERQLKAILQEINKLYLTLQEETAKLNIIQQKLMIYRNNIAVIALCAAYPFGGLRLTKH